MNTGKKIAMYFLSNYNFLSKTKKNWLLIVITKLQKDFVFPPTIHHRLGTPKSPKTICIFVTYFKGWVVSKEVSVASANLH
jgi:hypothetical protein